MLKLLFTALGCSAAHGVRPIGQGHHAVEASLGGPIARLYGAPVPIPLSSVGYRYGLSDRSDLHVRLHTTPLALFGLASFDAGASYLLADQQGGRPAVNLEGSLYVTAGKLSTGRGGVRFFGEAELYGSWAWSQREHLAYVGADFFYQPWSELSGDPYQDTTRIYAGPVLGNRFMLGPRTGLAVQGTWINPWTDVEPLTAHYYSPGQQGAIQLKFGVHHAFGGGE